MREMPCCCWGGARRPLAWARAAGAAAPWDRRRARRWVAAIALPLAAAACAPALDWREVRVPGAGLQAMFPCRPVAQTREVALAGATRPMALHACEAAGRTYAVLLADVGQPAAVPAALQALRDTSVSKATADVPPQPALGEAAPPGATPQPAAGRWRLPVPRPAGAEGGDWQLDTAVFARGTWVLQASTIGPAAQAEAVTTFFGGLRFAP